MAPPRILIVEDEGIIAGHIASRLQSVGYSVAGIAESSEEAIAKVEELHPELILMDIRIKGDLDGIETAVILRERFDIPLIFLTAHSDEQTVRRAKTAGSQAFLTKPIHGTTLRTSIEIAIHKHKDERELRRQQAWLETIIDTMPDSMALIDGEGKVQFLNPSAQRLIGWTTENARNEMISTILPLTDELTGVSANDVLMPLSSPMRFSELPHGLTSRGQFGQSFPIEGHIAPSISEGLVLGAVVTFRDATARNAREIEMRHQYKMQAVGRLAAGIAHDFNNLLFVILGYSEELLPAMQAGTPEMNAVIQIRKAAEDAAKVTQQLMSFSRKEPLVKRDLCLNDVIKETEDLIRHAAGPSIQWQFALEESLGGVWADLSTIKQVLMNLVANARDAMPEGGTITVKTQSVSIPGSETPLQAREDFVQLSVTDTGTGMSPATAELLFEPFFTTKDMGKGTGLGLSIVHSIVEGVGGSIHVDSEEGRGSTFTIFIPQFQPNETAQRARSVAKALTIQAGQRHPITILLVEAHAGTRTALRDYLVECGCKVIVAEDGEQAIKETDSFRGSIDVLLTDVVIPKTGGFELARALSSQRPDLKVVLISRFWQQLIDDTESLPADLRFMPKPFEKADLLARLDNLVARTDVM